MPKRGVIKKRDLDRTYFPKCLRRFYIPHVIKISYVIAAVFLVQVCVNIMWAVLLLHDGYTRGSQIYLGFQILLLMPFFPLILGTIFLSRYLLVPFMSALVFTTLLHILWMILLLLNHNESLSKNFAVVSVRSRNIVVTLWTICIGFSMFSLLVIILLWYTIGTRLSRPGDGTTHSIYPYRRYETTNL